ncbi:Sodium/hydrogen exchanger family-domain-containing protein [Zalerion maritima]|uniref:Sodium/hydrogen exchanger family-domain-containing protein n=1 Tax=Zalerion maritima TaxID=339359 RepID=A0AAD5RMC9_9PEZI|nr:Sodium/hydrogen exchanger family-domain-containing protein [Zalerion maritima]
MPTLELSNFNIVVSLLGGYISLFGLVSYLLKENYYMSEALLSLLAGVLFKVINWIRPLEYADGSSENVDDITLYFSRLVLGVQLVLAGIQLPNRYLRKEWKRLGLLVGPVMSCMWLTTSALVYGLVPGIPFVHALAVGACVTPTDPILSAVIVKGKFADHNVPKPLQELVVAESGTNDGLGYPFLFLPLYIIKYVGTSANSGATGGASKVAGMWFGETMGYIVILSVIYGIVVGYVAKTALFWAESRHYVDKESFLVFAISLALFILGTAGMVGTDDVLACFIAGNVFTWDDWFRKETADDSLQPTIDMLLNVTIFLWFGAVCPWHRFIANGVIPLYRLVPLGILILLLRRLPWVFAIHKFIPQIEQFKQALFVGFFGPIGVSAIFYLYIAVEFVDAMTEDGREDVADLSETIRVVVWFLVVCSVVVHGLSIPMGKLGFYLPQTLTIAPNDPNEPQYPFRHRVKNFIANAADSVTPSRPVTPAQSLRILALPVFHRGSHQTLPLSSPANGSSIAKSGPATSLPQLGNGFGGIFENPGQSRDTVSGAPAGPPDADDTNPETINNDNNNNDSGSPPAGRPSTEQDPLSPSSFGRPRRSSGGYGTINREQE